MSLFGGSAGTDWLNANPEQNIAYNPSAYQQFDVSGYGGGMGQNYQNATNQQLSGVLSAAQIAQLNQQFGQNLASIREGGYGMPSGAMKGLEYQAANQNVLNYGLMGQQNIAQGQAASMPYLSMGQNQNQFGNSLLNQQSQYGTNVALQNYQNSMNRQQFGANMNLQDKGVFGSLVGAGLNYASSLNKPPINYNFGGGNSTDYSFLNPVQDPNAFGSYSLYK